MSTNWTSLYLCIWMLTIDLIVTVTDCSEVGGLQSTTELPVQNTGIVSLLLLATWTAVSHNECDLQSSSVTSILCVA